MEKYIYLCGPTVYDKVHIGNMRPIVTFDLILRGLKHKNKNLKLIHNITDIDDKIIARAKQENISEEEIAKKYTKFYNDMLKAYNVVTVDYKPKVTSNINLIVNFIKKLQDKNFVYESNGSYYFKTEKLSSYGEVSNNSLSNLQSQNQNLEKENSFDFALWKNKTEGFNWDTKLGKGRPGWHTECAAFIYKYSKEKPLLIHGGGIDLKFPHHENENAQFKALTKNNICNEWLHVGLINFSNQKMSKSIGNIIYADEFLNKYKNTTISSDLFRLMILSSSIKSNIDINDEFINLMIKKINQFQKAINFAIFNKIKPTKKINAKLLNDLIQGKFSNVSKYLNQALKSFNENKDRRIAKEIYETLDFLGFKIAQTKISKCWIEKYDLWQKYLKEKQYEKADKIRKTLLEKKLI